MRTYIRTKQYDPDNLNKAERLVADELLKGMKSKDIGLKLHLSEATVKFHNTNIFKKIGVKSCKEFIARRVDQLLTQLTQYAQEIEHLNGQILVLREEILNKHKPIEPDSESLPVGVGNLL